MAVQMASQATAPADHRPRWGGQDWIQLAHHRGCPGPHRGFVRRRWHGCSLGARAVRPVCGDRLNCVRWGVGGTVTACGGTPFSPKCRHSAKGCMAVRRCATRTFACCRCVLTAGRPGDFDRIGSWARSMMPHTAALLPPDDTMMHGVPGMLSHPIAPRVMRPLTLLHMSVRCSCGEELSSSPPRPRGAFGRPGG